MINIITIRLIKLIKKRLVLLTPQMLIIIIQLQRSQQVTK